jgi:ATP-binding cassette subfamily B protein
MNMYAFFRLAVQLAARYPGACLIIIGAILVQVGNVVGMPILYKYLFDDAVAVRDLQVLVSVLAMIGVFFVADTLGGVVQDTTAAKLGATIVTDLRLRMFDHLQIQGTRFYLKTPAGDVQNLFSGDLAAIETALVRGVPLALFRGTAVLIAVVALFFIEWRLALATFLILPVTMVLPNLFSELAQTGDSERDAGRSSVLGLVQENVTLHLAIRTFRLQDFRRRLLLAMLDGLKTSSRRANMFGSLTGRSAIISVNLVILCVLGLGAFMTIAGALTMGLLMAFLGLLINIGDATAQISEAVPLLLQGAGAMGRVEAFFVEKPDTAPPASPTELPRLAHGIRFDQVNFSYGEGRRILDDLSLTIPAGQSVAFVGPSGSGKSTALSLILRLYQPESGGIFWDDQPLAQGSEASLRDQCGVVLQDTFLFNTTIGDNIRIGKQDSDEQAIVAAARAAGIHELVLQMPQGYATPVSGQGATLSGGQRQRIAIARALIRDPAVLVLDEATSALDAATEAQITETLEELSQGKTVIAVTHRLSTVTKYDRIFVMAAGRLVESGSHAELLERRQAYFELWQKQGGFSIDASGTVATVSAERLRLIPFLADCSAPMLETLTKSFIPRRFDAGQVIFNKGDSGTAFYLIAQGRALAFLPDADGGRKPLATMEDGDFFGEIALVKSEPRRASIVAVDDVLCLVMQRDQFLSLLEREPGVQQQISEAITRRLGQSNSSSEPVGQ